MRPSLYHGESAPGPAIPFPLPAQSMLWIPALTGHVNLGIFYNIPRGIKLLYKRWHLRRSRLLALPLALRDVDLRLRFQFI